MAAIRHYGAGTYGFRAYKNDSGSIEAHATAASSVSCIVQIVFDPSASAAAVSAGSVSTLTRLSLRASGAASSTVSSGATATYTVEASLFVAADPSANAAVSTNITVPVIVSSAGSAAVRYVWEPEPDASDIWTPVTDVTDTWTPALTRAA